MAHIAEIHLPSWRRFTDLTIRDIPPGVRLVVLAGPNGLGKSSIFDGFRAWQGRHIGFSHDPLYYNKVGSGTADSYHGISIKFHDHQIDDAAFARSAFTFRTAYRMEADFQAQAVQIMPALGAEPRINRMTDNDVAVSQNFQRLLAQAVGQVFGEERTRTVGAIQDELLGSVRVAMANVFGDLQIENLTNPLQGGAFYFSKGQSRNWHFKNLSGGERAAFDLLLDMAVKAPAFPEAIYCIDEPETHLNTRVQGELLNQLLTLLPPQSQLWIATHSIGMLKSARQQQSRDGDVVFLDFEGHDMDQPVTLRPAKVDRAFWARSLRVALDDLADLVAPQTVVLVEGRPIWEGAPRGNVEFDARCLRIIFASEFADTDFISVGSAGDVEGDTLKLGTTTPMLTPGTQVIRVVDRDDRSNTEADDLRKAGVRVLRYRDLENYLLSDEALTKLCEAHDPRAVADVLTFKKNLLAELAQRGKPSDDVKAISGRLYVEIKSRLKLTQVGNTSVAFLADTMTAHLSPDTTIYQELKEDIFGP